MMRLVVPTGAPSWNSLRSLDGGDLVDGVVRQGHDGLVDVEVGVAEVDRRRPLLAVRHLAEVEVEVLLAGSEGQAEGGLPDPVDLVGGEAERLGDGVRDGPLVALARGREAAEVGPLRALRHLAGPPGEEGGIVGAQRQTTRVLEDVAQVGRLAGLADDGRRCLGRCRR